MGKRWRVEKSNYLQSDCDVVATALSRYSTQLLLFWRGSYTNLGTEV